MNFQREKYRKLFVRELGDFAQLPLFTRALAAELLKVADDDGFIALHPERSEWTQLERVVQSISFRVGATKQDRALLRQHLPALLAGASPYLVFEGPNTLRIRNFVEAQRRVSRAPTEGGGSPLGGPRARAQTVRQTPTEPRQIPDSSQTIRSGTVGVDRPNLAESHDTESALRQDKRREEEAGASSCARPAPTHAREDPPPVEPFRPAEPTPEAFELLAAITEGAKATPGAWDHRAASSTIVAFVRGLRESQRTRAELVLLGAFLASSAAAKELHRCSFSPDWFVVRRADGEWDTRRIDWAMRAAREWQSRVRSSTPRRDAPSPLPSGLDRTGLPVFRRPTAPARAPAPTGGEP